MLFCTNPFTLFFILVMVVLALQWFHKPAIQTS